MARCHGVSLLRWRHGEERQGRSEQLPQTSGTLKGITSAKRIRQNVSRSTPQHRPEASHEVPHGAASRTSRQVPTHEQRCKVTVGWCRLRAVHLSLGAQKAVNTATLLDGVAPSLCVARRCRLLASPVSVIPRVRGKHLRRVPCWW